MPWIIVSIRLYHSLNSYRFICVLWANQREQLFWKSYVDYVHCLLDTYSLTMLPVHDTVDGNI